MRYPIIVQSNAVADAESIREELAARDPAYAERWLDELDGVFEKPAEFPNRFALAPEAAPSGKVVRQMIRESCRDLYSVRGDSVRILRIRHAARRPLNPE
jgi:plasmid stabilization system protein ParE